MLLSIISLWACRQEIEILHQIKHFSKQEIILNSKFYKIQYPSLCWRLEVSWRSSNWASVRTGLRDKTQVRERNEFKESQHSREQSVEFKGNDKPVATGDVRGMRSGKKMGRKPQEKLSDCCPRPMAVWRLQLWSTMATSCQEGKSHLGCHSQLRSITFAFSFLCCFIIYLWSLQRKLWFSPWN